MKQKHIKLFEDYNSPIVKNSEELEPDDIMPDNFIVFAWLMDGVCACSIDGKNPDQVQLLVDLMDKLEKIDIDPKEDVIKNRKETPNCAYVVCTVDGDISFEGPGFKPKTKEIGIWVNSECGTESYDFKTNPNPNPKREEDLVMTLKKGYVTYSLASGHGVTNGQMPLKDFMKNFITDFD